MGGRGRIRRYDMKEAKEERTIRELSEVPAITDWLSKIIDQNVYWIW